MNTGNSDMAARPDRSADSSAPARNPRRLWSVVTALIVADIFAQAAFAGAMLSGVEWARTAHSVNAVVLIAATLGAGLVAVVTLRRIPHGATLGFTLLALAVAIALQTAVGISTAHGANLMWLHVPLGVALVGLAGQIAAGARRLGEG